MRFKDGGWEFCCYHKLNLGIEIGKQKLPYPVAVRTGKIIEEKISKKWYITFIV